MFYYVFFEVGAAAFASIAIGSVDWFDSAAVVAHARCGWSAVISGLCLLALFESLAPAAFAALVGSSYVSVRIGFIQRSVRSIISARETY